MSWAHPKCVVAELRRVHDEREERAERREAERESWKLPLARAALDRKPYKARHKSGEDPACELCFGPILPGELCRKKSRTSSKRMHDTCVREVLSEEGLVENERKQKEGKADLSGEVAASGGSVAHESRAENGVSSGSLQKA